MPWPSRRRLILGISGEVYRLCDAFLDTLAAGAVNGTPAVPGPGTRADPNNNTSVGNGVLLINSTTDICYFDEAVTRAAGMVYVAQITAAASTDMDVVSIGFDDAKTAAPDRCAIRFAASDVLQAVEDGTAVTIGSYAGQTSITVAFTLRATGAYFKVKLGTGAWKLYKIGNVNSTATLYAGVGGSGGAPAVSVAWHRVPAARWLDAPVCYDPFASDGALTTSATTGPDGQAVPARTWSGATWTVAGGKLLNTPTLGAELGTDVDMEDNPASNWTAGGGAVLGNEAEERTGGAGSQCLSITNPVGGGFGRAHQAITMAAGTWFELRGWIREVDDGGVPRVEAYEGANYYVAGTNSTTSWVEYAATFRLLGANPDLSCRNSGNGASLESRADDFSIKPLTLSQLLNIPDLGVANVVAEIEIAVDPAGTQAGLAIGWDSAASPANGILVYHDGTNVKIDKNVAGTWTSVQSTATAFSANAKLVCVRDGSSVSVFYNNALIGSTQTISDAAILAATRHGMFSTNATPTMDNVLIMPRTGGNYSDLDRWSGVNP